MEPLSLAIVESGVIMHVFGSMDDFQIQYKFLLEDDSRKNSFEDTWGEFRLYVSGNDLCEFCIDGTVYSYQNYLYWITEWLCENLVHIVGYDPFPIPVSGNTAVELLENANTLKLEMFDKCESEMLLIGNAVYYWSFRHSWFASRGGTILPLLNFRRMGDCIEISWDNAPWVKEGVCYTSSAGCSFVRLETFKKTVLEFIEDYLRQWCIVSKHRSELDEILSEWRKRLFFDVGRHLFFDVD